MQAGNHYHFQQHQNQTTDKYKRHLQLSFLKNQGKYKMRRLNILRAARHQPPILTLQNFQYNQEAALKMHLDS